MMKKYVVRGEYGPIGTDYHEVEVTARDMKTARKKGIAELKELGEYMWSRMGNRNVYVEEKVPENKHVEETRRWKLEILKDLAEGQFSAYQKTLKEIEELKATIATDK